MIVATSLMWLMLNIEGKDEKLVVGREAIDKCEDIKNLAPSNLENYVLLTQEFGACGETPAKCKKILVEKQT